MLAVALAVYLPLALLSFVPLVVVEWERFTGTVDEAMEALTSPVGLLTTNLSLAAAIPAALVGILAGSQLRPGWLGSVTGRLRWGLLWRTTLAAVVVVAVFYGVSLLLPVPEGAGDAAAPGTTWATFGTYAAIVVLTTPLQAAGEEYAFRGVLLQVVGAWVRWPVVGGLLSALLFALAHGSQNVPLFLDRFAFGLVAWWLVVRTGGLEAAISMHVVNNVVVFLVAAAFGQVGDSLTVTEAPWVYAGLDVVQLLAYVLMVEWLVVRRRRPAVFTPSG